MQRILFLTIMTMLITLMAQAQIDPNLSSAVLNQQGTIFNCPAGDGQQLGYWGMTVTFTVVDINGQPMTGLTYQDFEVDGFTPLAVADAYYPGVPAYDLQALDFYDHGGGVYVYGGYLEAGGLTPSHQAIGKVQGVLLQGTPPMLLSMKSADFNSTGAVDLADVGMFTQAYYGSYARPFDMNSDGVINLLDVGLLGAHYGHRLPNGAIPDPVD